MKITKSQTGFTPVHALLLLVLLGIIGFTGWKVYDAGKSTGPVDSSAAGNTVKKDGSGIPEGFIEYKSNELGFKLAYPKDWGEALIKQGEFVAPGRGSYKQVSFNKNDLVDINFVIEGFSSPLDACGYSGEPLKFEEYGLNARRSSVIGWDSQKNLKILYGPSQGNPSEQLITTGATPSNGTEGFEILKTDTNVMVYRDLQKQTWKAMSGPEAELCGEVTQAVADQANLFRKYIHFAVNFTTAKVRGVNAQYDARNTQDQNITNQLIEVLNGVKPL